MAKENVLKYDPENGTWQYPDTKAVWEEVGDIPSGFGRTQWQLTSKTDQSTPYAWEQRGSV